MKAAIVIPAHNESPTIGHLVTAVSMFGTPIVVDDGSSDGTGEIATAAGAVVVTLDRNRGYDMALERGFHEASNLGADIAVTFDADGQHDPKSLPAFVDPLARNAADLVVGVRPESARFMEALFSCYTRIRYGVPDILCGLKGYRMELYRHHGCFDSSRSIGTELTLAALRQGKRVVTVPVNICEREGSSRLGGSLRANLKIFRAMLIGIGRDLLPQTRKL